MVTSINDPCACFRIRQFDRRVSPVDEFPLQGLDFAQATPGQQQKLDAVDCGVGFHALCMHLFQRGTQSLGFFRSQKPFALLFRVFLDVTTGIGSIRTQPPHLSQIEHFGYDLKTPVRFIRRFTTRMVKCRYIGSRHTRNLQMTNLYQQTLLVAIQDVESAIYGYVGAVQQRDSLISSVQYHRQAFEQSRVRYVQGLSNFLDVLDSQRTLTQSQQDLADAETDLELETINLYSAVGLSVEDVERYADKAGIDMNNG